MPKTATTDPVRLFRALGDPTRLRLLALLGRGEVCVCDLVDALRVPQPTASRHLAALRRAGLVTVRKQGLWSYYAITPAAGAVHAKALECLAACAASAPELAKDRERLEKVAAQRAACC